MSYPQCGLDGLAHDITNDIICEGRDIDIGAAG